MKLCMKPYESKLDKHTLDSIRKISNLVKLIADFCLTFDEALIKIKTVNMLSFSKNKIE